ncbi:MAG: hypothetical protein ABSE70_10560 [Candidatus Limnocylindrales bacterium]
MTVVRIATVDAPLNGPALLAPAVGLVRRALALGLLADQPQINRLDLDLVRDIAREASRAGVGQDAALGILQGENTPERLRLLIGRLDGALAESAMPDRELRGLLGVFDLDGLATLLGTSAMSLRRYLAGTRAMPDMLAARTHWLALVVADLAGAYNAFGIRRWFDRPRPQLGGRPPREAMGAGWTPESVGAAQVAALAGALAGVGAAT